MTLTPSDIEQKTFSTALRGYNLDEVDDFLDEIVRSMRKLQEELEEARAARVEIPPAEPEPLEEVEILPVAVPVVEPTPVPPLDESAVGKALIAAQETAERIVTDARSEADQILVRARTDAENFEETRLKRKADAEQEISRIDVLVDRVKSELAGLSTAVGADLDDMTRTIDAAITELDEAPADIDEVGLDEAPADIDEVGLVEAPADIDEVGLVEAAADIDEVGEVEAAADIEDEADEGVSLGAADDENLIASDEPELPPGLVGIEADRIGSGDDDASADVEDTEDEEGSGEDSESDNDEDYFNFPDGDDDEDDDDEGTE
jgi:DivIVA domain-containing protein